jgi:hypothetical protein
MTRSFLSLLLALGTIGSLATPTAARLAGGPYPGRAPLVLAGGTNHGGAPIARDGGGGGGINP